jgi:DNA-damage-inducible protein J
MADTIVRSRIDPELKRQADQVLRSMGLTMSDAIRLFLHQVVAEKALPFAVKAPNATTLAAMEAVKRGEGLETVTLVQLAQEWDAECGK